MYTEKELVLYDASCFYGGPATGTGLFLKSVVSKTDEFVLSNFNYKKIDGCLVLCNLDDEEKRENNTKLYPVRRINKINWLRKSVLAFHAGTHDSV
jgi:hypothetical protein